MKKKKSSKHKGIFLGVNLKTYIILVIMGIIGTIAILPYIRAVIGQNTTGFMIRTLLTVITLTFLGLMITKKIGLDATPIIDKKKKLKQILKQSIIWGIAAGILIIIIGNIDILFKGMPDMTAQLAALPNLWQGFLASFYGGITEEIMMRLFMLSLFAFIITGIARITKGKKDWKATSRIMWSSIIFAALVFGIGHLGALAAFNQLTTYLAFKTILLNSIGGIIFGWLFWKKGIESAMIAHFSADIVLYVVFPATLLAFF